MANKSNLSEKGENPTARIKNFKSIKKLAFLCTAALSMLAGTLLLKSGNLAETQSFLGGWRQAGDLGAGEGTESGKDAEGLVSGNDAKAAETQELGVVVLDAGHGGIDGGKVGINGAVEKDINLSITMLVKEMLEERGFQVVLTRDADENLGDADAANKKMADLNERIRRIEQADPVLAVSIHQNSYTSESASGPQVFYYKGSENGEALAESIQQAILAEIQPEKRREVKENDSYYLLKNTKQTMVIVECGFLSNKSEADLLIQAEYQERMAGAIAEGIAAYCQLPTT